MRAHYLQHVSFEGLGSIEPWLCAAGYQITSTPLYDATVETLSLPKGEEIDLLVVLGGPMSANDLEAFPWLVEEVRYIAEVIATATPVLGICLGAQLIARALGAKVYPNHDKEIGWFSVDGVAHRHGVFQLPNSIMPFHWHGETFDLPQDATILATSEGCRNQAFQVGTTVVGLQFHLESTPSSVAAIVNNCRDELVPSRYIQREEEILSAGTEEYSLNNRIMDRLLNYLTVKKPNGLSK